MDPATLSGIGTLVGGLGSLAGGLGLGGSSGSDFPRKLAKNPLKYLVKDARKYGINPLAALGVSTHMPPSKQVSGKDFAKMGQGIRQVMRTPLQKELAHIEIEQQREILKGMKLDNVGKNQEIHDVAKQTTIPVTNSDLKTTLGITGQTTNTPPGVVMTPREIIPSQSVGREVGTGPVDSLYINEHKSIYPVLSEKAAEGLESDTFASRQRSMGKKVDYITRMHAFKLPNHPRSQSTIKHLRNTRPKAPKGYEARYNAYRGLWVLRPKVGGKSYLFDKKRNDQYRMWRGRPQFKMKKSH